MSRDPFSSASSFDKISDHFGRLLLITPVEHVFGIKTEYSTPEKPTTDAIDAEVVVLDGPDAGTGFESMRIFQGPIISTLKRAAKFNDANPGGDPATGRPKMILGRLGRGEDKTGKLTPNLYGTAADKRPWILLAPAEADKQLARDYLAKAPAEPANPFEM
jgi:hypothetical protein